MFHNMSYANHPSWSVSAGAPGRLAPLRSLDQSPRNRLGGFAAQLGAMLFEAFRAGTVRR